jgi:ATP-binding cassette, subfamily B (MDR/TAP), member 1
MKSAKTAVGYSRLLLAGNPSKADTVMLFVGFLSSIASGIPFPLIGIIFGQLLNDFNSASCTSAETSESRSTYQDSVDRKILLILYLAIAQFVTIYVHLSCWSCSGARLAQRLREQYLQRLLRQEPLYFDKLPPGEASARLNGDIQAIRSGTSEKVGICISSLSFFVTAYIVAFIKDVKLAAMLTSLIPAYFLMSMVGSHYIEKYSGLVSDHTAAAASIASEALSNVMVVHAFGASARLEGKFAKVLKTAEGAALKKAAAVGIQSGALYFIAYSANGLAFWQGSKQVADVVHRNAEGASVGAIFTVIFILVEGELLKSSDTQES